MWHAFATDQIKSIGEYLDAKSLTQYQACSKFCLSGNKATYTEYVELYKDGLDACQRMIADEWGDMKIKGSCIQDDNGRRGCEDGLRLFFCPLHTKVPAAYKLHTKECVRYPFVISRQQQRCNNKQRTHWRMNAHLSMMHVCMVDLEPTCTHAQLHARSHTHTHTHTHTQILHALTHAHVPLQYVALCMDHHPIM